MPPSKVPPAPRYGPPSHKHTESYTKTTLVIFDRQIEYLDGLSLQIRKKTGASVRRAEIIRALVDFLKAAKIDPAEITSEEALRELLVRRWSQ